MIAQKPASGLLPKYRIPAVLWMKLAAAGLLRQRRSFFQDASRAVADGRPALVLHGGANIPSETACVAVCNHYNRPGFDAWWIALGISAALGRHRAAGVEKEIHWVMTAAWTFPANLWRARLITPLTYWAFTRVAHVYGFIAMPPMPPVPDQVQARAAAVLQTVRLAKKMFNRGVIIGLAPEGQDFDAGQDAYPAGVGEFIALLVNSGLQVLPVGVYESGGALHLSFGRVFQPVIPLEKASRDQEVSSQVRAAIQALLAGAP